MKRRKLTKDERRIRKLYTRSKFGNVWLTVDVQSFTVVEDRNRQECARYRDMLAAALNNLINEEIKRRTK